MPINLRMKQGFLYLATTKADAEDPTKAFIAPYAQQMPFATTFRAQLQTSANGQIVGQQIGRPYDTQQIVWERYDSQEWWNLNQWLETNGMCFWCHYFAFNAGEWRTRQFYCSEIQCEPYRPAGVNNPNRGEPMYYTNCTLTITDMGA